VARDKTAGELTRGAEIYTWSISNGKINVCSPDGATTTRRLGGSDPESVARLIAARMEKARSRNSSALPERLTSRSLDAR